MTKQARSMLAALLATLAVAMLGTASTASAAMFVPAKTVTGIVSAVSHEQKTLTVGGQTFCAKASALRGLYPGYQVRIQYIDNGMEDGRVLSVTAPGMQRDERKLGSDDEEEE